MQIRILKGTTTIGGALTEITTSKGTKIELDMGLDLDDIVRLPEIDGLNTGEPTYDGVIISHYHGDHYGRINEVLPTIPVYMSDQARSIIETVFSFTRKGKITHPTIDRITTITRVANRTGRTIIWDILLNMVLQKVTQKIPNALNSPKVYCYLPSYLYRMRNKEPYSQYIEPYLSKIKQTGKKLHERKIPNELSCKYVARYRKAKVKK